MMAEAKVDRMIRRDEVERRIAMSTTTLYRMVKEGRFPAPKRVGQRAIRWSESEVMAWLDNRPKNNE